MINSLKLYETLKSADLSEPQARAITTGIETAFGDHDSQQERNLAQKVNTARFETEMHQIEASLKNEMHQIDAALRQQIVQVEVSLKQELQGVKTALAETKFEMLRWLFIFWAGQVAATVSVIKLLR